MKINKIVLLILGLIITSIIIFTVTNKEDIIKANNINVNDEINNEINNEINDEINNNLNNKNNDKQNTENEYTGFKATIIGSGGPIFNSERNGPSVLISNGDQKILVDMGGGTQSQLDTININIKSISGFLITHHHLDHNEELIPIFIKSLVNGNKFTIAGPTGTQNYVSTIEDLYQEDIAYRLSKTKRTIEDIKENYIVKDVIDNEIFSLAEMKISTTPVIHTIETIAYRFDIEDKSIVVSGDLTYSPTLPILAKNADILIMDSGAVINIGETKKTNTNTNTNTNTKTQAHATLEEIGQMANDANVKTLVLTHFSPEEVDTEATQKEIAKYFPGEIIFGYDLLQIIPSDNNNKNQEKQEEEKKEIETPITNQIQNNNEITYKIVDTDVSDYYSDKAVISKPSQTESFYGQDAHYQINNPSYTDNKDGTITDEITGLIWQQDMGEKMSLEEAIQKAETLNLGEYNDWRIPTIKELYSLILFTGQVKGEKAIDFFIDTNYFNQPLGDTSLDEREIDAQTWSSTEYVGRTMKNDETIFGVNFIDGRIKGYPKYTPKTKEDNKMYFRLVRGNEDYGKNNFIDNNDGTISDLATGLMWQKEDNKEGLNWEDSLSYAENLEISNYNDWRLPNTKELQSIVDYSRSPQTTNSAAIDTIFDISTITDPNGNSNYPFFWTSTTHLDGMNPESHAAYVCFGEAQGEMNGNLIDVHGAGAQRSDPKSGNIQDYPDYFGPQGDIRYVYNYVRAVRNIE